MKHKKIGAVVIAILLTTFCGSSLAKQIKDFYANKAHEKFDEGKYQDALQYAYEEIKDYPDNSNGYYEAALSFYMLNEPGKAIAMLNDAIEKANKEKKTHDEYFLVLGGIYLETGDSIKGLQTFNNGLKKNNKSEDLLLSRIEYYYENNDIKNARKDIDKLKKLNPRNEDVYYYDALVLRDENKKSEALSSVNKAIQNNPKKSTAYALRAIILRDLGKSPDWIRDFLKSYEVADGFLPLNDNFLNDLSDQEKSEIISEIEKNKTPYNNYSQLGGTLLMKWGIYGAAIPVYEEIISSGKATADDYVALAYCYEESNIPFNAYLTVSKAADLFPDNNVLKFMKARIGTNFGKGEDVIKDIDYLISQEPENFYYYQQKGKAYMSIEKYAEAVEPLSLAYMLYPDIETAILYADALRLSGDKVSADKIYNKLINEANAELSKGDNDDYNYYTLAMAYSGMNDSKNAVDAIKNLEISLKEKNALYAMVYSRLGMKSAAIESLSTYLGEKILNYEDLYNYELYPLHSEKKFQDILAATGIKTRLNPLTQRLELDFDEPEISSNGTSWKDAKHIVSDAYDVLEAYKSICPIDIGMNAQIQDVDYNKKNNTIIFYIGCDNDFLNFDLLNSDPKYKEKKEDVTALSFMSFSDDLEGLDATLLYKFKSYDNSKSIDLRITPEKIKKLKRISMSQDEIDKMLIDFWFEEEKSIYRETNEPIQMTKENNFIVYKMPLSDENGELTAIELFSDQSKRAIMAAYKEMNIESKIQSYIRQNISWKFIYVDPDTGKSVEIIITPQDMLNFLN